MKKKLLLGMVLVLGIGASQSKGVSLEDLRKLGKAASQIGISKAIMILPNTIKLGQKTYRAVVDSIGDIKATSKNVNKLILAINKIKGKEESIDNIINVVQALGDSVVPMGKITLRLVDIGKDLASMFVGIINTGWGNTITKQMNFFYVPVKNLVDMLPKVMPKITGALEKVKKAKPAETK